MDYHYSNADERNQANYLDSQSSNLSRGSDQQMESPRFASKRIVSFDAFSQFTNTEFKVQFKVRCETKFGQCVCIIGGIDELGAWKNAVHLKWTAGHVWVLEHPLKTKQEYFTYKYVIMQDSNKKWEHGVNRIADLKVLQIEADPSEDTLTIDDTEFNHFKVRLAIYYPINSSQYIVVSNQGKEADMIKQKSNKPWLKAKYGKLVAPYFHEMITENHGNLCCSHKFEYSYIIRGMSELKERVKTRSLVFKDPNDYIGSLGMQGYQQQNKGNEVFVVNGMVDKADGNFLKEFEVINIGENLYIGSYPQTEQHVLKLKQEGITAVLNLQTSQEIGEKQIDYNEIKTIYQRHDIKVIEHPVPDGNQNAYYKQIFKGCKILHKLLEIAGDNVFVQCTSGLCRSPTLVTAYICLYIKHPEWSDANKICEFVESQSPFAMPNMKIVNHLLSTHADFQQKQYQILEQESLKNRQQLEAEVIQISPPSFEQTITLPELMPDMVLPEVGQEFESYQNPKYKQAIQKSSPVITVEVVKIQQEKIVELRNVSSPVFVRQVAMSSIFNETVFMSESEPKEESFNAYLEQQNELEEEIQENVSEQYQNNNQIEFEQLKLKFQMLDAQHKYLKTLLDKGTISSAEKSKTLKELKQVYQDMDDCINEMNTLRTQMDQQSQEEIQEDNQEKLEQRRESIDNDIENILRRSLHQSQIDLQPEEQNQTRELAEEKIKFEEFPPSSESEEDDNDHQDQEQEQQVDQWKDNKKQQKKDFLDEESFNEIVQRNQMDSIPDSYQDSRGNYQNIQQINDFSQSEAETAQMVRDTNQRQEEAEYSHGSVQLHQNFQTMSGSFQIFDQQPQIQEEDEREDDIEHYQIEDDQIQEEHNQNQEDLRQFKYDYNDQENQINGRSESFQQNEEIEVKMEYEQSSESNIKEEENSAYEIIENDAAQEIINQKQKEVEQNQINANIYIQDMFTQYQFGEKNENTKPQAIQRQQTSVFGFDQEPVASIQSTSENDFNENFEHKRSDHFENNDNKKHLLLYQREENEQAEVYQLEKMQQNQSQQMTSTLQKAREQLERAQNFRKTLVDEKIVQSTEKNRTLSPGFEGFVQNVSQQEQDVQVQQAQHEQIKQDAYEMQVRQILEQEKIDQLRKKQQADFQKLQELKSRQEQEQFEMIQKLQQSKDLDLSKKLEEEKQQRLQNLKEQQERDKLEKESIARKKTLVMQDDPYEELTNPSALDQQNQIPCAFGDQDLMGLSEAELDRECDEIFSQRLIDFKPRKDNGLDRAIAKQIKDYNINIPIVCIKGSLFLVGTNRVNLLLKRDFVLVRAGGGYIKLHEYIPQNNRQFMRQLVVQMIKTGDSLEVIVQKLIEGDKIANLQQKTKSISPVRKSFTPKRNTSFISNSSSPDRQRNASKSASRKSISPYQMQGNKQRSMIGRKSLVGKLDEQVIDQQNLAAQKRPIKGVIQTGTSMNKSKTISQSQVSQIIENNDRSTNQLDSTVNDYFMNDCNNPVASFKFSRDGGTSAAASFNLPRDENLPINMSLNKRKFKRQTSAVDEQVNLQKEQSGHTNHELANVVVNANINPKEFELFSDDVEPADIPKKRRTLAPAKLKAVIISEDPQEPERQEKPISRYQQAIQLHARKLSNMYRKSAINTYSKPQEEKITTESVKEESPLQKMRRRRDQANEKQVSTLRKSMSKRVVREYSRQSQSSGQNVGQDNEQGQVRGSHNFNPQVQRKSNIEPYEVYGKGKMVVQQKKGRLSSITKTKIGSGVISSNNEAN